MKLTAAPPLQTEKKSYFQNSIFKRNTTPAKVNTRRDSCPLLKFKAFQRGNFVDLEVFSQLDVPLLRSLASKTKISYAALPENDNARADRTLKKSNLSRGNSDRAIAITHRIQLCYFKLSKWLNNATRDLGKLLESSPSISFPCHLPIRFSPHLSIRPASYFHSTTTNAIKECRPLF